VFLPPRPGPALAAALAALLLAACDGASASPSATSTATGLLLPGAPQGYALDGAASGPLDLDAARVATLADPTVLGTALGRDGFGGGAENVWTQGSRYETDIVLRFHTAAQAEAVLEVEHAAMQSGLGVVAAPAESIPDSWAYTMFGATRQGNRSVFCQGVWFAAASDIYGITTCAPTPGDEHQALLRASAQLQRAATAQP
jgi:hypothetical protein